MIDKVFSFPFMYEITLNWICLKWTTLLWICSGESATVLFSPTKTNVNNVTIVTAENQIFFDINIANSEEKINKSFEQHNVSFE